LPVIPLNQINIKKGKVQESKNNRRNLNNQLALPNKETIQQHEYENIKALQKTTGKINVYKP